MLEELRSKLSPRERELRDAAFRQADAFIQRAAAAGGVGPVKKTFPRLPDQDGRRVDIEVHKGLAFVPLPTTVPHTNVA